MTKCLTIWSKSLSQGLFKQIKSFIIDIGKVLCCNTCLNTLDGSIEKKSLMQYNIMLQLVNPPWQLGCLTLTSRSKHEHMKDITLRLSNTVVMNHASKMPSPGPLNTCHNLNGWKSKVTFIWHYSTTKWHKSQLAMKKETFPAKLSYEI